MKFWKVGKHRFLALHDRNLVGFIERDPDRPWSALYGTTWRVTFRDGVRGLLVERTYPSIAEAKRFCEHVLAGGYVVAELLAADVGVRDYQVNDGVKASLGYCVVSLCLERARAGVRFCDWHYSKRKSALLTARYGMDIPSRWSVSAPPDSVGSVIVVALVMEGETPPVERWPTPHDLRDDMASRWDFARALYVSPDYGVWVEAAVTPKPTSLSEMQRAWRDVGEFIDCHFDIPMNIYRIREFNPAESCHIDPFGRDVFARAESEVDPMNWD